ncbi:MAG: AgmX/PglI C-terminal domain-containing protein [Deltaproteobacteria bacterium]|nr:AgmX/PglI C-terminal domain-containing protein [Deltaproteobacteria bacterium]
MTASSGLNTIFRIKLLRGSKVIRIYKVASESISIGSDQACTLKMAGDPSLMPMHATLYQEDGEITVVPESGATVLLNNEPIDFGVVGPGDVVRIGRMAFHAELVAVGDSVIPESGRQSRAPAKGRPAPPVPTGTKPITMESAAKISVSPRRPTIDETREYRPQKAGGTLPSPAPTAKPQNSRGVYPVRQNEQTAKPTESTQLLIQEAAPPKASIPVKMPVYQSTPPARDEAFQNNSEPETAPTASASRAQSVASSIPPKSPIVQDSRLHVQDGAAPQPMAIDPDDYFFDEDEDDFENEFNFTEVFNLAEALNAKTRVETKPSPDTKLAAYCAADVVRTIDQRVVDTDYIHPGRRYHSAFDDFSCRCNGATIELVAETPLIKGIWRKGTPVDVRGLPQKKNKTKVVLESGDTAILNGSGGAYQVDVYRPPAAPLKSAFGFNSSALALLAGAIVLHVALGLTAFVVMPEEEAGSEAKDEEVYAVVEMEKPEFKKEETQKPDPKPVEKDATAMAERAPQVTSRQVRRVRERATKATTSDSIDNLMKVLSRGSGKEGKSNNIKDLVSNIDAVSAGNGSAAYNIAGAIGSIPGGDVNVAREGGGGILSTLSGEQVAGKDSKIATLARSKPSGKIRGKVTKMTSGARVKGSLSKEDVSRVVNANIHAVQACYEKELLRSPGLSGRIVFDWTVKTDGRVSGVRVRSSTLSNSSVSQCISDRIKKWKFPRPKGGEVVITYPFLFRSVSS